MTFKEFCEKLKKIKWKKRSPIMPSKKHKDKSKYSRKEKHKKDLKKDYE